MRKILLLSILSVLVFSACKKKHSDVSQLVTVSYPTVKITNGIYYSFPVGGGPLPSANTIQATAYDSFYKEKLNVVVDATTLSNSVPGLYIVTVSAKNRYGYVGYGYVYVAVSNVNDSLDLTSVYHRSGDAARPVHVQKVGRNLYTTDNLGGVDIVSQADAKTSAVFAVTSDTTLDFGAQTCSLGSFTTSFTQLSLDPSDTTFQYSIIGNGTFSGALRTFHKH